VNAKANQYHREQVRLTSEPQQARRPVQTFEQKQEAAEQLAKQIADHLARGGSFKQAKPGESASVNNRNPSTPRSRALKLRFKQ